MSARQRIVQSTEFLINGPPVLALWPLEIMGIGGRLPQGTGWVKQAGQPDSNLL
ncbi:hypothetical protein MNV_860001 [Candidatus Methanoperedens nitroreducens]|uniref:Uncharacterized protein n=1 Tax=Candidatus Methanoperedens nitratireducens TaxID=1392998 RepID=A0A284VUA1_9EURY|nr:hypothetical protein MNV_860001 [Candidatus Methanoperedens nitroreducens]